LPMQRLLGRRMSHLRASPWRNFQPERLPPAWPRHGVKLCMCDSQVSVDAPLATFEPVDK
ncbi:unnamed protein product, partial [Polarella glacialis]